MKNYQIFKDLQQSYSGDIQFFLEDIIKLIILFDFIYDLTYFKEIKKNLLFLNYF